MDSAIRSAQKQVLKIFTKRPGGFALAGGTALELFYLNHRFSSDLDFFSPAYCLPEIERLAAAFQEGCRRKLRLESDLEAPGKARVRFYTMPVQGARRPLKIDFVEDVLFEKPVILRKEGVPVYSAENIYLQKIAAISGVRTRRDELGRELYAGRGEARDVFDLYVLSEKVFPLHRFLPRAPLPWQKGIIHWYRTFSRQELKLALMDQEIYDPKFDSREMIRALEQEIQRFTRILLETP